MSEKLMAGVITAVVIAPLCSICIIGLAALGAFLGGIAAWFSGLGPVAAGGLTVPIGVFVIARKRRSMKLKTRPDRSVTKVLSINTSELSDVAVWYS